MRSYSVVFYHSNNKKNYDNIYNLCAGLRLNVYESNDLCSLLSTSKMVNATFIIIDATNTEDFEPLIEVAHSMHDKYTFIMANSNIECDVQNTYFVNESELIEYFTKTFKKVCLIERDNNQYQTSYKVVSNVLRDMDFSAKHVGLIYLKDLITELLCNRRLLHSFYKEIYHVLAIRYNSTPACIERTIRFCIKSAYEKGNKEIANISNSDSKAPTIKETTNYIVDKILVECDAVNFY